MATQSGGGELLAAARVDVTVDMSQLELGIKRANEQMAGMADATREQYGKMNKAERQRVDSLQRQIQVLGLNRQEQLAYNITMRTTGKLREDLLRTLGQHSAALTRDGQAAAAAAAQFDRYGLSAKQTQAALRQVPAQMTDIFVSLQGGQNPLTVLLQQGGQLKDVFGGIRPAAAALGNELMKLINPYTLLAAGIGAVAVAAYKGEQESNEYRKALAMTGDQAGVTTAQLQEMARSISGGPITEGKAAEALVAAANAGKFVGNQFQIVAEAAVNMERATGQALDTTVQEFAKLAGDPTAAVAKLNQEHHFLTAAIYEQIKALQEEGNTQAAATLAMQAYADAVNERTAEVEDNLGTLQTAWKMVAIGAKAAWDAMLDIGRDDSSAQQITDLTAKLQELQNPSNFMSYAHLGAVGSEKRNEAIEATRKQIWEIQDRIVNETKAANRAAMQQQANDYAITQDQLLLSKLTGDEKRAKEIERSRKEAQFRAADAEAIGQMELAKKIRDNQAKYEAALEAEGKKKTRGNGASLSRAETREGLQEFKDILTEKQAVIRQDTAILQAEYAAKLVTQQDYFAKQAVLIKRGMEAEEQSLTDQIEFLRGRNVTGREAIDIDRQLGQLEAQLTKVRIEGATQLKVLGIQEQAYNRARKNAMDDYAESLDLGTDALRDQIKAQIDRITMSEREFDVQQRVNQVLREGAEEERRLAKAKRDGQITPQEYEQQSAANARAVSARVEAERNAYGQIAEAQQDWRAAMRAGLDDWMVQARDVAGQVRDITIRSLDTIAEGFAQMALTGKFEWKSMLASILTDITKFMMKQAVLEFIGMIASMWGGGAGGNVKVKSSGGFNTKGFATGGVFEAGILTDHSNTIVNKPTPFFFAKGAALGVMGEAGEEAIMPLTRGSDGNLGVRAFGGGGAADVNVTIQTIIQGDGGVSSNVKTSGEEAAQYRKFAELMANIARQEVQQAMRPGGTLWKAGVSA